MSRVLLVEDDLAVRRAVTMGLKRLGHDVEAVADGRDALDSIIASPPDIVVLDLMIPGINGIEVCKLIRARGTVPVVILSARDHDIDIVAGFDAGADDYCVKPASAEVIDARIRAVLRRSTGPTTLDHDAHPAEVFGDLAVDRASLRVRKGGAEVSLTPTELRLLLFLSSQLDHAFSRQQLLEHVWEQSYYGEVRMVDACVTRLRAKIETDPRHPVHLQTVRGFGYRFSA
ncbi:response regulator transcription factor [Aeromicrobium fastidiosum]|uniref:Response regulator transcription factor n=1 Tax=Aeromicrobium fastidiosum TaxID=52699 RepID=A0A641AKB4_9ACTN|nr:response regulator transcription factor [Aeromicrobium fastidiosum]KAA1376267.1 response regulator transcription factor [Aeromicrobium fastidiosum]MBP2391838.1 DNA-binding response OmpR family regulator [Aeromicrobium fastidiosum]